MMQSQFELWHGLYLWKHDRAGESAAPVSLQWAR